MSEQELVDRLAAALERRVALHATREENPDEGLCACYWCTLDSQLLAEYKRSREPCDCEHFHADIELRHRHHPSAPHTKAHCGRIA